MQVLGSGTRDVEILTPLHVKGTSTTFNNNVIVGATKLLADTALTVLTGARIDGNLTVAGSLRIFESVLGCCCDKFHRGYSNHCKKRRTIRSDITDQSVGTSYWYTSI